jgi:hypothetical protein
MAHPIASEQLCSSPHQTVRTSLECLHSESPLTISTCISCTAQRSDCSSSPLLPGVLGDLDLDLQLLLEVFAPY